MILTLSSGKVKCRLSAELILYLYTFDGTPLSVTSPFVEDVKSVKIKNVEVKIGMNLSPHMLAALW